MNKKAVRVGNNLQKVLPAPILEHPRFLLWKSEYVSRRGKVVKTPYYTSGRKRKGELDTDRDLKRLVSLPEAISSLSSSDYSGIGFALVDGDNLGAFDVDKCLTPEGELISDHAGAEIVKAAEREGAYIEISPSGRGLRILGKSSIGRAYSKDGLEYWGRGRYVTLTGTVWANPNGWTRLTKLRKSLGGWEETKNTNSELEVLVTRRLVRELTSALEHIDADERDTWIRMGMALKSLGDKGQDIWMEWSATSPKFEEWDARRVWSSLEPKSTGHRAIFAEAMREGWDNPRKKENRSGDDEANPSGDDDDLILVDDQLDLGDAKLLPTEFVLDGYFPTGLTLIAGSWGAGKSTNLIPLFACSAHITPEEWGLWPEIRRKVVWVTEAPEQARDVLYSMAKTPENGGEDDEKEGSEGDTTRKRGRKASSKDFLRRWELVKEWFRVYPSRRSPANELALSLRQLVQENSYELENGFLVKPVVVLDTLASNIQMENENDNAEAAEATNTLKQLLPGVPIVLVGHTPKGLAQTDVSEMSHRGAGAFEADAVATYYLVWDQELDFRYLVLKKCRFFPRYREISFGVSSGREIVKTPWGDPQSKSYLHGIPSAGDGEERKERRREAEAEKEEMELTERHQNILDFTRSEIEQGRLVWVSKIGRDVSGSAKLLTEATKRMVENGILVETLKADLDEDFWVANGFKKKQGRPVAILRPSEGDRAGGGK